MHELSQSASYVDWFKSFPYGYASADSTPLYIIAVADYLNASGDNELVQELWDSVKLAYRFAASTDTDNDGLIENSNVGHGWVEGGALYPAHEEIYLAGLWAQASRSLARLADLMNDHALKLLAGPNAQRSLAQLEKVYWREPLGIYAFGITPDRTP